MNREKLAYMLGRAKKAAPFAAPEVEDEFVIDLWHTSTKDIDDQKLIAAFASLIKSGKFPSIDDVLRRCGVKDEKGELEARETVSALRYALCHIHEEDMERARKRVGDLGWRWIQSLGGFKMAKDMFAQSYQALDRSMVEAREWMKGERQKVDNGTAPKLDKGPDEKLEGVASFQLPEKKETPVLITGESENNLKNVNLIYSETKPNKKQERKTLWERIGINEEDFGRPVK